MILKQIEKQKERRTLLIKSFSTIFLFSIFICLISAKPVYAQAAKLKFVSPPRASTLNNPSSYIRVEAWDSNDMLDTTFNETVILTSSSPAGLFSVDRVSWQDTSIITFSSGVGIFYYKDPQEGNPVITAYRDSLTPDTQVQTVELQGVNETASYIIINSFLTPGDGSTPCTVVVVVNDTYGFPVSGKEATIITARGPSQTTVNQPLSPTDANGQATGSLISDNSGVDTIMVICDGHTITRGIILEGCEGIWHFDTDMGDYSGKGYNAINNGGLWTDGIFGSAIFYNDDPPAYAECSSSTELDTTITVEAWVKILDYPGASSCLSQIIGKRNDAGQYPWMFVIGDSSYSNAGACLLNQGNEYLCFGGGDFSVPLPLNEWLHLLMTFKEGDFNVYLNGEKNSKTSSYTSIDDNGQPFRFSNNFAPTPSTEGSACNAIVDEVKVYSRVLDDYEIASLYKRTCTVYFTAVSNSFRFISAPFTVTKGNPSPVIIVEALDSTHQRLTSFNDTAILSSSSPDGKFSTSNIDWIDTTVITFVNGVGQFYYKDALTGNPAITVFREGFTSAIQSESIVDPSPYPGLSWIQTNPWWLRATGRDSVTCIVTINDTYGYPVSGLSVTLYTIRGQDTDAISENPQVTDASGKCTFTLSSQVPGRDTVTAACEGNLITNIYFLDDFTQSETLPRNWEVMSGDWEVLSGGLRGTGAGGRIIINNGNWSDYTMSAKINADAFLEPALLFRLQDTSDYYHCKIKGGGKVQFSKFVAGVETLLGETWTSFVGGNWYTVKLEISGNTFSCYINNALILTASDSMSTFSSGKIGLECGIQTLFDDVIAYPGTKDFEFIPVATKLKITSSPQTLAKGVVSAAYPVEARYIVNGTDYIDTHSFDTVSLISSSPTGRFSPDRSFWSATNEDFVYLNHGVQEFYYKDITPGTYTITVYRTGLVPDTQQVFIIDISETTSFLRINTSTIPADGTTSCNIVATLKNSIGEPVAGQSILLVTGRGTSYDTLSANPQISDENGQCTFTVRSPYAGEDTFYAVCGGITILENILPNPSFEDGTIAPENWVFSGGNWTWTGDASYDGNKAISNSSASPQDNYAQALWQGVPYPDRYPVSPGALYSGSCYCRTELSSGYAALRLIWYSGADTVSDTDYCQLSGLNTWTYQSVVVSSPSNANYVGYRLENRGAGTVWFDCVFLRRVPSVNFTGIKIKITTPERRVGANLPSDPIIVQLQDASGLADPCYNDTVLLSSSSATGRFSADKTYWSATNESAVALIKGSRTIYYLDSVEDSPVITVSRAPYSSDTQVVNIISSSVSEKLSYLRASYPAMAKADGIDACTITVVIKNGEGRTFYNKMVTVQTSRGPGYDIIAYPFGQYTDGAGACIVLITSSYCGEDTVIAICDGLTITENILNNPSFEESFYGETLPSWWDSVGDNPQHHTGKWTWSSDAHSGLKSVCHTTDTAEDNYFQAEWEYPYNVRPNYPIIPNTKFFVSQYVKTNLTSGSAGMRIIWFKDTWNPILEVPVTVSGNTPWTCISDVLTAPSNAVRIMYRCQNYGVGTVWFDECVLRRIPTINFYGTNLVIITPPRTASAGTLTDSITVEVRDNMGNRDTTFNGTASLSSSSVYGEFFSATTGQKQNYVEIINGAGSFYYKDSISDSPVITVYRAGFSFCTQTVNILPAVISETASYIRTSSTIVSSNGITPCTVTVFVRSLGGAPLGGRQVTIFTSRGPAYDTITQPGLTDFNGMCTGTIVSSIDGTTTIAVATEDCTITNLYGDVFDDMEGTNGSARWAPATSWQVVGGQYRSVSRSGDTLLKNLSAKDFTLVVDYTFIDSNNPDNWGGITFHDQKYLLFYRYNGEFVFYKTTTMYYGDDKTVPQATQTRRIKIIVKNGHTMTAYMDGVEYLHYTDNDSIPYDEGGFGFRVHNTLAAYDNLRIYPVTIRFLSADKIVFTTPERTVGVGDVSESIGLQAQTKEGTVALDYNGIASISSTSSGGMFSDTITGPWSSTLNVHFVKGEAYFYYKDTKPGNYLINVSTEGLPETSQQVYVTAGSFNATSSYIVLSSPLIVADGVSSCTIQVYLTDRYRNTISSGNTVTVLSSNGAGDTITYPYGNVSDENGMVTATLVSTKSGTDVIIAKVQGFPDTITLTFYYERPVGMWDLDEGEGSAATSYNGLTGSVENNAQWVPGRYGTALQFESSNHQRVIIPDTDILDITDRVSMEAWVKLSSPADTSWLGIMCKGGAYMLRRDNIPEAPHPSAFVYIGGQPEPRVKAPAAMSEGVWYYLVATYDRYGGSGNLRLYVDGVLVSQVTRTGAMDITDQPFYIGSADGGANYFDGIIDDARLYNRVLSEEEISAYYKGRQRPVRVVGVPTTLVFTSPERTVSRNACSPFISVEVQDIDGNRVPFNDTAVISSSSPTGRFSLDKTTWSDTCETTILFSNGSSTFYYFDTSEGTFVFVVSRPGLSSDTQNIYIVPPRVSMYASYLEVSSSLVPASASSPCTVTVYVRDPNGSALFGLPVTVQTSRGPAYDTITYVNTQTDMAGRVRVLLSSSYSGNDNITATCEGVTVDNIIPNPSFEDGAGVPDRWIFAQNSGSWSWVSTEKYEGEKSIKHTASGAADNYAEVSWPNSPLGNRYQIRGTDSFEARMYIKTNNTAGKIRVIWWKDNNVIGEQSQGIEGTNDWTLVTYNFAANPDANGIMYRCQNSGAGEAWFDCVYLKRIPAITFTSSTLVFTTPAFKIKSGTISPRITVVAMDEAGSPDPNFNGLVDLTTTSQYGSFSLSSATWTPVTQVRFSSGTASFYYRDYRSGNPTIQASYAGYTSAVQTETITASKLVFASSPYEITTLQIAGPITVQAQDALSSIDTNWNETASLVSSSPRGKFSGTSDFSAEINMVRFSGGETTFYYRDTRGGSPTITIKSLDIQSTQRETVVMPVIVIEKTQRNLRITPQESYTASAVLLNSGDTIEWKILLRNTGKETAINLSITDTIPFDSRIFEPVVFVSMDTQPLAGKSMDSWTYTTDPAFVNWEPWFSVPPPEAENVRGLRWFVNALSPKGTVSVRFRVRVK